MLAIVTSDKRYANDLLEKINYSKELSPNKCEIYKCTYKSHEFVLLISGYGKINIGSNLRFICDKYNIKAILAIGTAGSISDTNDIFSAIIPKTCVQFDVDFMPNGYSAGQIPQLEKSFYDTNEDLTQCLQRSANMCGVNYSNDLIATSDMYVSNYNLSNSIRREYNAGAVDCECGSIGEFSFVNNIPYACVKVISNFSNNNGIKQYNLYDEESSRISQRITYKFLKEFYEA